MNYRHLEAFVAVADHGSFTRAAEAMFLTQPTVSGQIREFEEELGLALFHRESRAVTVTEAGALLLPVAREALSVRTHLLEVAAQYRGVLVGCLEIHASTVPGEHLLPSVLARFKRAYPGIQVRLSVHDSGEVFSLLEEGAISLGVVGEVRHLEWLECAPLWSDRIELYAACPFSVEEPFTMDSLKRIALVFREAGSATQRTVDAALKAAGISRPDLTAVAEIGSSAAVKEAIKAGVGAGFLSSLVVDSEQRLGLLRPIRIEGLAPIRRSFFAVRNGRRKLSPAEQAFWETLLASPPFPSPEDPGPR